MWLAADSEEYLRMKPKSCSCTKAARWLIAARRDALRLRATARRGRRYRRPGERCAEWLGRHDFVGLQSRGTVSRRGSTPPPASAERTFRGFVAGLPRGRWRRSNRRGAGREDRRPPRCAEVAVRRWDTIAHRGTG